MWLEQTKYIENREKSKFNLALEVSKNINRIRANYVSLMKEKDEQK